MTHFHVTTVAACFVGLAWYLPTPTFLRVCEVLFTLALAVVYQPLQAAPTCMEREKKKDNKRDGQKSSLSLFRHSLHVPTQHMHWRCGPPARHRLRCSIRIHVVIDEGRASFYLLVFFFVMCLCPHPPHLFISNIALAVFLLRCAHHHHPHALIYRIIYRLHLRVRPVHDQQGTNLPRRP